MGSKITGLTENTSPTGDDLLELVNDPAGTPLNQRSKLSVVFAAMQTWIFGADAGASDTYVVTLSPVPAAYVTGQHYRFKANTANTGACTVNFNGLGAKTIKKAAGGITTDLADNDIRAGQWVDLVYDGTNMQMQSLLGNVPSGAAPGAHAASHENGGADEISVTGLSGVLADPQTPITESVQDIVGAMVVAGTNVTVTYNDGAGTLTIDSTGGGGSIAPLFIESANVVAQRNGTNPQNLYVYKSTDGGSNWSRLNIGWDGLGNLQVQSENSGTGTLYELHFRYGGTRQLLYGGANFRPDANNVTALGTSTERFSEVRAVNLWAQTAFILEGGSQITDAGASFGGVVKFSSITTGPGTWTGGSGTPSAIGANQNDYNPVTLSYFQRWSSSTAVNITGMTRFQQDGQVHLIVNIGANNITLKHQDTNSAAANRFLCSTGADIVLAPDQAADAVYDSNTLRWRIFKRN